MKKTLVFAFTLLGAATVYAQGPTTQNTSTIEQIGESQIGLNNQNGVGLTGVITQTGAPGSNSANEGYMVQSGQNHSATITQTEGARFNRAGIAQEKDGFGSEALIQQIGSGGQGIRNSQPEYSSGEGNWAGIAQHGEGNRASVYQNEGQIPVGPSGPPRGLAPSGGPTQKNFGEIWQYGSNNGAMNYGRGSNSFGAFVMDREVLIDQSGGMNNRGEIFQGDDTRGGTVTGTYSTSYAVSGNGARIYQTNGSTENFANVRQFSNENDVDIWQSGSTSSLNRADVRQGLGESQSNSGSNITRIDQTTNSTSNTATVGQYGEQGTVYVYQYGYTGASTSNVASVSQTAGGSQNEALIEQGDMTGNGMNSTNNRAAIVQGGQTGYAKIEQGFESTLNTAQIGQGAGATSSTALIGQRQSTGGIATITQNLTATGSANLALIEQGVEMGAAVTSMSATIGQEGSNNTAKLLQLGTSHQATINQYGNGNIVKGLGTTTTTLNGAPNTIIDMAEQTGTGHSLTVTQVSPGGANTSIFNSLDIQQSGTGSTLTIMQVAETTSNVMTLRQSGSSNQAIIQQNGVSFLP